jgi:hypothetical protein
MNEYLIDKESLLERMNLTYLNRIGDHVECDNIPFADAIYEEFVIDGEEPGEDYEWLFLEYIEG